MRKLLWAALATVVLVCPAYGQLAYGPLAKGDITAAATCPSTGVRISTRGMSTATIEAQGSFTATLTFKYSNDGINFQAIPGAMPQGGGIAVTSTTATGKWTVPLAAYDQICVDTSAFTSGTATVVLAVSTGAQTPTDVGLGFNGAPTVPRYCDKVLEVNATITGGTAAIQLIAGVGNQLIWICDYQIVASTATAGTAVRWVEGTGSNCATGQTNISNSVATTPTAAPTSPNLTFGPANPATLFARVAGDSVCLLQGVTTNATTLTGWLHYTQN